MVTRFQQLALDQTGDRRRSFDLLATVREIVDLTRLAHRHDPVEIIVTGEPELVMDSYPGAIGQVLGQLVENAIAHGFAGHRDGTIDVRVWPSGREEVRVTVRDDGAGIAPEALPRLFAPFFPTPGEHGGNGLGLGGAHDPNTDPLIAHPRIRAVGRTHGREEVAHHPRRNLPQYA